MAMDWGKIITAFLVLSVFLFALSVVTVKHKNRVAFIELNSLSKDQAELSLEWERLRLGLDSFGHRGRIESIARKQMGMYIPSKEQTMDIVIHE